MFNHFRIKTKNDAFTYRVVVIFKVFLGVTVGEHQKLRVTVE